MDKTTCNTCRKTFTTSVNLQIHMNRKKPCISPELAALIPKKKYKFKCERCEQTFQTNQNLTVHLNKKKPCEIKEPTPEEMELRLLFEKLKEEHLHQKEENEDLKVKIDKLENQPNINTTNNVQNNNNTINNNNNVTINVYGKENTSHITDAMYISCFELFNKSVEKLISLKHFSSQMQENHNFYISNMRDAYMMIYNTKKWNVANKDVVFKDMYYKAKGDLFDAWDRLCQKKAVSNTLRTIYPKFIIDDLDDERDEMFKKASCDKIACMAYNNRDFPMKIKKEMDLKKKLLN